jgi:PadR family transcriptional regulator PadR
MKSIVVGTDVYWAPHVTDPERSLRKFRKELNAGVGSLLLLGVLARSRRPMYGYEICRHLAGRHGELPMQQGALYPVLRVLEASGLLTSEVEPSVSGPPRRYYRATRQGRAALAAWREAWSRMRDLVESVLQGEVDARSGGTLSGSPAAGAAADEGAARSGGDRRRERVPRGRVRAR